MPWPPGRGQLPPRRPASCETTPWSFDGTPSYPALGYSIRHSARKHDKADLRCVLNLSTTSASGVHGGLQYADIGQLTVLLSVIEAIPHDELVINVEADVLGRYLHLDRVG